MRKIKPNFNFTSIRRLLKMCIIYIYLHKLFFTFILLNNLKGVLFCHACITYSNALKNKTHCEEKRPGDKTNGNKLCPRAASEVVTVCETRGICLARTSCMLPVQIGLDLSARVSLGSVKGPEYGDCRLELQKFTWKFEEFFFINQWHQTKKN